MSLNDIFDPMVRAHFSSNGSGGDSGGGTTQSTGVMAVAWHSTETYEPLPDVEWVYKISDITPLMGELGNAKVIINVQGVAAEVYNATVNDEDGMVYLGYEDDSGETTIALVMSESPDMPPDALELCGFYICISSAMTDVINTGVTVDIYVIWEP